MLGGGVACGGEVADVVAAAALAGAGAADGARAAVLGASATAVGAADEAGAGAGAAAGPAGLNARTIMSISAALVRAKANLSFMGSMNCPLPSCIECSNSASGRLACHLASVKSGIVGIALRPIPPLPSMS